MKECRGALGFDVCQCNKRLCCDAIDNMKVQDRSANAYIAQMLTRLILEGENRAFHH